MNDIKKVFMAMTFLASALEMCCSHGYSRVNFARDYSPVVATYSGSIRGKQIRTDGIEVSAFLGIPYAEPPIGDQRFKKAVPKQSWLGVYDATTKPQPCMQYSTRDFEWMSKVPPSENCLYLNIWVPGMLNFFDLDPLGKPVMLWIHGGGYFSGSSDIDLYDGATLAAEGNVIVVSVNYRLGAFGFLTDGTDEAPGNMGLYDQYLAMEWVRNNIRQFSGDPDRITLFGESAGAISAGLHLISPMSRNLFRRAILESGSPYHPFLAGNSAVMMYASNIFATAVGCADDASNLFTDRKQVLDCLRGIEPLQLAVAESYMLQKVPFLFLPIHGDDFMPLDPITAMNKGDFKRTEIIVGSNPDEGALFLNYIMPDLFGAHIAPHVSVEQAKMLIAGLFQNSTNPLPQVVVDFYLRNASDDNPAATLKSVYDSFGDFLIHCPAVFFAEQFAKASDAFFYTFTHRSSNTPWGEWMGSTHFMEVPFVFGDPMRNATCYTAKERDFSRNIIQKWATFARCGIPVVSRAEAWPLFTSKNHLSLELNPESRKIDHVSHSYACDFWRQYFATSS